LSENRDGVTLLLKRWQSGDSQALDFLLPQIYDQLKRLAKAQLSRDCSASIQATELVAEVYLKLVDVAQMDFAGRAHFLSLAARTMRRILVERYRHRAAIKRSGEAPLLSVHADFDQPDGREFELERLDDALVDLERLDARQAEIVTLRFFGGLEGAEIAAALGISERTVKREWAMAKLWLYRELKN
jgi:RNA polymerase sigma factor (TIGR02999 family)